MIYQYPTYYSDFQCINKDCPDTCCGGWEISIDPESLERYRRILHNSRNTSSRSLLSCDALHTPSPAFLLRFRKSIDFNHSTIRLSRRFCPLLTKEKLCGMYIHLGKDSLCRTCRTYPRHQEDFGSLRELSLSLSCPEAARIILSQKTSPRMETRHTAKACPSSQQVDKDLLAWLIKARRTLLNILWKPNCSLETSVSMALSFSHDLQRRLSKGCFHSNGYFCPEKADRALDNVSRKYLAESAKERFVKNLSSRIASPAASGFPSSHQWLSSLFKVLASLDPVVDIWPGLITLCRNTLSIQAFPKTAALHPSSDSGLGGSRLPEKQLLTYFIQVYFPGAVYDHNLFDKIRFAAVSWLAIRLLAASLAGQTDSLHRSSPDAFFIQAAYLYSRQAENYDRNLNAVFNALHTHESFRLIPFLSFLNSPDRILDFNL